MLKQPDGCYEAPVHSDAPRAVRTEGSFRKEEEASEERWLPVVGFQGWYEVSDLGRVRRIRKPAGAPTCRVLKATPDTWGYYSVHLGYPGKKQKTLRVHLLVADAFKGPRPKGFEVDHEDGVKSNCRLDNLDVVTHGENQRRAYALGIHKPRGADKRPRAARISRTGAAAPGAAP